MVSACLRACLPPWVNSEAELSVYSCWIQPVSWSEYPLVKASSSRAVTQRTKMKAALCSKPQPEPSGIWWGCNRAVTPTLALWLNEVLSAPGPPNRRWLIRVIARDSGKESTYIPTTQWAGHPSWNLRLLLYLCQSNQITVNIHRLSERAPFYETPETFLPCGKGYGLLWMNCFPRIFNVTYKGSAGKGLMWYWLGRLGWVLLRLCFAFLWTDEQREGSELQLSVLSMMGGAEGRMSTAVGCTRSTCLIKA